AFRAPAEAREQVLDVVRTRHAAFSVMWQRLARSLLAEPQFDAPERICLTALLHRERGARAEAAEPVLVRAFQKGGRPAQMRGPQGGAQGRAVVADEQVVGPFLEFHPAPVLAVPAGAHRALRF